MASINRLIFAFGTKIRLKTNEGDYIGFVSNVNKASHTFVLERVTSCDEDGNEMTMPGLITFQKDEILDYEFLSLPKPIPTKSQKQVPEPIPTKSQKQVPEPKSKSPVLSQAPKAKDVVPKVQPVDQLPVKDDPRISLTNIVDESQALRGSTEVHSNGLDDCSANEPDDVEDESAYTKSIYDRGIYFSDIKSERDGHDGRPNQYVVVEHIDGDFYEMMDLIFSQTIVGCGFDGVNLGRNGKLCWIQIATRDVVIIFDLLALDCQNAFDAGLADILQSSKIIKVTHDCRQASDLLFHQYNIKLVNIYDTQVADVLVARTQLFGRIPKYARSLATCLKIYLNLTSEQVAFYEIRKASVERDKKIWHHRPINDFMLESIGLNVRYLRELRLVTLEGMMADFTLGVDIYLHTIRDKTNEDTVEHCKGEVLPTDFQDFSYESIIESRDEAAMPPPRAKPRPRTNAPVVNGYTCHRGNTDLPNGHEGPDLGADEEDEMPLLEEILPVLERRPTQNRAVGGDRFAKFYGAASTADRMRFESGNESDTNSLELRMDEYARKLRRDFEVKTPDCSSLKSEERGTGWRPNAWNGTPRRRSSLSSSSVSSERCYVEEPTMGAYLVQPKICMENAPKWEDKGTPKTTHINIPPAGMRG